MLNRFLSVLLSLQIVCCVLSLGFTPAVLIAFALMIAAPVSFLKSMATHGMVFVLAPCVVGLLAFQGLLLSPVFLVWLVLIVVASAVAWNRGPDNPEFSSPHSR